jgi:adenylate cyclase
MKEIERKFLIDPNVDYKSFGKNTNIKQGYLSSVPERTVRVRATNNTAFITIKGISSDDGLERFEWEKEISIKEAAALFHICEPGVIEKTRVKIPNGETMIEVDIFHGKLEGLFLAEIELESKDQKFDSPEWFLKEVTGESEYYNSNLVKKSI